MRLGHHAHAVIDRADILEQRRNFPHDPLRHAVDTHGKTDRDGDRADGDSARQPQIDSESADREKGDTVVCVDEYVEERNLPHLPVNSAQEFVHARAGVCLLPPCMGEELDRAYVGVAVDDAPGHHRARVGLFLGDPLQPRNEIGDDHDIDDEPQPERHHEAPISGRHDNQHRRKITHHIDEDVEDLHHRFTDGKRRLHDLRRHPPGKFVGEERHALPQQIAMHLPTRDHRIVAEQHLMHHEGVERHQPRQADEDQRCHPGEPAALGRKKGFAIGGG